MIVRFWKTIKENKYSKYSDKLQYQTVIKLKVWEDFIYGCESLWHNVKCRKWLFSTLFSSVILGLQEIDLSAP